MDTNRWENDTLTDYDTNNFKPYTDSVYDVTAKPSWHTYHTNFDDVTQVYDAAINASDDQVEFNVTKDYVKDVNETSRDSDVSNETTAASKLPPLST